MNCILGAAWLACAGLTAGAAVAQSAPSTEQLAQQVEAKVLEWRRDFHRHPELGNRETRTAAAIAAHLRRLGLEVRTGVAHTGVIATLHGAKPGPLLALRADMDALPVTERSTLPFKSEVTAQYRGETVGVMHACGHDAHSAILMGVAQALAGQRERLTGSVLFVFQPAEEGPPESEEGGAGLMLKEGVFAAQKPAAIFGLHVWAGLNSGQIGLRSGAQMAAADEVRILVHGKQTHGALPWNGVDPIVAAAQIVQGLQMIASRQVDITRSPVVISIGTIKGGIRFNVIPDRVELTGTMRTFGDRVRADVQSRIVQSAEQIAASSGASAEVSFVSRTPVLVNDPALGARLRPTLESVAGRENTLELPFQTIAEDFGYFAEEVPGLFFFVGVTPVGQDPARTPPNHSPDFLIDEAGLKLGVQAMLALTFEFLAPPP